MRALLTGGTGFVGAAVARALLREGWQVRALARPTSDRRNLLGLEVETVDGDFGGAHGIEHDGEGGIT
jgi:dihydroflavonol-4-reductase